MNFKNIFHPFCINCMKQVTIKRCIQFAFIFIIDVLSGCKKFIEVDPPVTSINQGNVYSSDATAISVMTGMYTNMSNPTGFNFSTGINSISVLSGLSADELTLWTGNTLLTPIAYYKNLLSATTNQSYGSECWGPLYDYIFDCNSVIEGLNNSTLLTLAVKQQLLGEAKFMRAYFYFYLVNLFGDVPLVLTTNYKINTTLARVPKAQVYQQIVSDLKDAQDLLSTNYLDPTLIKVTTERVRPTRWAATALLARTYLYTQKYDSAEIQATNVINSATLFDTVSLNNVFLKNSKETIWQLQPVVSGWNTEDAKVFNLSIAPTGLSNSKPVYLSSQLLNSFEAGDNRKLTWASNYTDANGSYFYPNKYKATITSGSATEYLMILRLGEQYLIRAEARAQIGNISGAQTDLNIIRKRAGLLSTTANDKSSLLSAILHERQVELFTELGHRWLDLKRTNKIDGVMTNVCSQKGTTWNGYQQLYPLPLTDLLKDPNLIQNPGY